MRHIRLIVLFILCLFPFFGNAQNSFTVEAPNVVGSNEAFRLIYTADGKVDNFTQPTITGANILVGPTPSTMQRFSSINGKTTQSFEVSYTYILKPTSSKLISISQASAQINGKTYHCKAVSIDVVDDASADNAAAAPASQQDNRQNVQQTNRNSGGDIILKLIVNKTRVVKGEPITAVLKLYTNTQIVGFEDIKFPVFNGFWSQETEAPQNLNFVRERLDNKIYSSAVLRKYILLPQQSGELTIDPAEMIAQIQVRVNSGASRGFFDDFFDDYQTVRKKLATQPVTINVRPLPAGAPASFGGGVGNFTMKVRLSRDSIKTNEAASLIVDISGAGNMNLMEAPKYDLPNDFEVYDVKTSNNFNNSALGMQGTKSFEFPFIPRAVGKYVLPPVEYSFYDLKGNKYVTLTSDSLRINVTKGVNIAGSGVLSGGLSKQEVANLREDVRYIATGDPSLRKMDSFFVLSPLFFVLVVLILVAGAVASILLNKFFKLRKDVKRTKSRKANKLALKRLNTALSYLKQNLSVSFYEELHKAIMGYVADKLSIPFADLQKDNISEELLKRGVPDEDISELISILDECEMARYSQQSVENSMQTLYDKALESLSHLENIL